MSLILEALRKSEAERQRGRAPGLFVEHAGLRRERRSVPAWAFWTAGGVLVAVLLVWGWRESIRDDIRATAAPAAAGAANTPSGAAGAAGVSAGSPAQAAAAAPAAAASSAPMPGVEAAPDPARLAAAPPAAEPEPVATVDTADAAAPAAPDRPTEAAPAAPFDAAPQPAPPSLPATASASDAPAPAPAQPPAPAEEVLPRLADVPAGERGGLPPLKLSMHVYSDDPARRFIIVDGQRLTEGAAPAAGVVVEQIRRDGAVLSLNGRRVLLGRP